MISIIKEEKRLQELFEKALFIRQICLNCYLCACIRRCQNIQVIQSNDRPCCQSFSNLIMLNNINSI